MFRLPYLTVTGVFVAVLLTGCTGLRNMKNEWSAKQPGKEQEIGQVVTVLRPISGVPVSVTYLGGAFYHLEVTNTLTNVINLLWDESAYVDTNGGSIRLLCIPKRNDLSRDPPAQQSSPPIAPDSRFQADFIGESWLDAARRGATPLPKDSGRKARLYLAFNIKGKRVEWQGEIAFVPPRQP